MRSFLALVALPAMALAVSLSDFTPRVSNLPSGCKSVYTSTIDGCSAGDFGTSSCSKGCVLALQKLSSTVTQACGGKGISGSNIIAAFLDGQGPTALCTNAQEVLGGGSSASQTSAATTADSSTSSTKAASSTAPSTSSAAVESSSSTDSSTTATATASTASSADSTSSSPLTTSTSSGLLVDTTTQSETASATSSSGGSSQTNVGDNSGGGSPFDTQGNLASGAASTCGSIATALITAILALAVTLR